MITALLIAGILLGAPVSQAKAYPTPAKVTFRYKPNVGGTMRYLAKGKEYRDMGTFGDRTEETEAVFVSTTLRTKTGYAALTTISSMKMSIDGKPVPDQLGRAFKNLTITHRLDQTGYLESVVGYGELLKRIMRAIPAELHGIIDKEVFNEERLTKKEYDDWYSRVGSYMGETLAVGEPLFTRASVELPDGGTADYLFVLKPVGFEPCGNATCVRLDFRYASDAKALTTFVGAYAHKITSKLGLEAKYTDLRVTGEGSRLINPETMELYSERSTKRIKVTVEMPDDQGKIPVSIVETSEVTLQP